MVTRGAFSWWRTARRYFAPSVLADWWGRPLRFWKASPSRIQSLSPVEPLLITGSRFVWSHGKESCRETMGICGSSLAVHVHCLLVSNCRRGLFHLQHSAAGGSELSDSCYQYRG